MNTKAAGFPQFVQMGILHIASGIDHLAFLLALLITARKLRQVLMIVTGFTLGHSLTLSLAASGGVIAHTGGAGWRIRVTTFPATARHPLPAQINRRSAGSATVCVDSLSLPLP